MVSHFLFTYVDVCNTSDCGEERNVCSIGAIKCTGCNNGYYLATATTLEMCLGENSFYLFLFYFVIAHQPQINT